MRREAPGTEFTVAEKDDWQSKTRAFWSRDEERSAAYCTGIYLQFVSQCVRSAMLGGSWLNMRTSIAWHIRVTPRGRPVECDTGVPRCEWGVHALQKFYNPHATAHPCHTPWAARGM